MKKAATVSQADGRSRRAGSFHGFLKRQKVKAERRAARKDPEVAPAYGRYSGYET